MLVCHCNQIRLEEIEQAILSLLEEEPYQLIVPVQVYRILRQRGKCCGCFPAVVDTIVKVTAEFHEQLQTPSADIIDLVARLKERNQDAVPLGSRRNWSNSA